MWHVWVTGEVHIGIGWGDLREIDHLEYLGVEGRIILK
jgi:hypothetical protein